MPWLKEDAHGCAGPADPTVRPESRPMKGDTISETWRYWDNINMLLNLLVIYQLPP